jgi:hypothetical protein
MNVTKPFWAALALAVLWQGVSFAGRNLTDATSRREAFAARYENDGVYFSTAGLRSQTLVVNVYPPDTANCSNNLDVIANDHDFVDGLAAMGFVSVECLSYSDRDVITGMEVRKLVPRKPARPFKPLVPNRKAVA